MYRVLALTLFASLLSCAAKTSSGSKEVSSRGSTPTLGPDSPISDSNLTLQYPEKAEVMRLIVRATALESNGRFQDALSLANQALAVDPNSPTAIELKGRLEELLRRA